MRRIFKSALVAIAALVAVGTVVAAVLTLGWPLWVALFLMLLVAGAACGGLFLRQLWLRRRTDSFMQDLPRGEDAGTEGIARGKEGALQELRDKWQGGIQTLRTSHLKKHGNPLYVLPWYLVIGERGAGKTTSLTRAMLSSPLQDPQAASGAEATRNCDWWFLEHSVVIDTAGRYSGPVEETDRDEWRALLRLLAKYRRRESLNGVLVAVPANRLQSGGDALNDEGRTLRRRLDELMTVLGVRFPVYVLVTKCDFMTGLEEFAAALPEKTLAQAMGVMNLKLSTDVVTFAEEAFASLSARLRDLRLQLLLVAPVAGSRLGLLVFPEELAGLKQKMAAFLEAAFGANQYQETPILRGIFFSCGEPQGSASTLMNTRTIGGQEGTASTSKGIFLHDLFAKILPHDRPLVAPTRRALQWQQVTGSIGLLSWLIVGIALCGLLTFSFIKNLSTIRQLPQQVSRPPEARGDLAKDLLAIDSYRQQIMVVEERNGHWWMPRFGLTASLQVEKELKARFCRKFHDGFLSSFDRSLGERAAGFSAAVPDEVYGPYLVHLARRINLLKARLNGQGYQALKSMPAPEYLPLAASSGADADAKARFAANHLYYLIWRADSAELGRDISLFQNSLKQLLALKGGSMQWLSSWVDRQSGIPPVTLADFWGGTLQPAQETRVAPVFTRKGQAEIESLVREIEAALPDHRGAGRQRAEFEQWYRPAKVAAWQSFASAFPRGAERLKGEREWQEVAAKMATDQGPYFALLNRLAVELEAERGQRVLPPWLQQLYLYQALKVAASSGGSGAIDKASQSGKKILATLQREVGKEASASAFDATVAGSRAVGDYLSALSAITPATVSRAQAYQAAAQLYAEDPAASKSAFVVAFAAANKVGRSLSGNAAPDPVVARLINGPADFMWHFVRQQAAGHLQSQWEEQVLAGTLGMTGQQATPLLLGPDGLVWKFVRGPAAPFLTRSVHGYRSKEVLGGTVAFDAGFFSFLERGSQVQAAALSKQTNYSVGIQALPTDTNPDARLKPHATRLELQCGGSSQTLANLNYPVGKTFNWSPDSCADVVFQIEVGELVLTRRYMGPQGFPDFLQDFKNGRRSFEPKEFPGEKGALQKMGIKYIRANYQFAGSGAVVKQAASSACGQVPRSIAKCWSY